MHTARIRERIILATVLSLQIITTESHHPKSACFFLPLPQSSTMRFPGYNRYSLKRSTRNSVNKSISPGPRDTQPQHRTWKRESITASTSNENDANQENQNPLRPEDLHRAKSFNQNRSLRPRSLLRTRLDTLSTLTNVQGVQSNSLQHVNELPTPPASPEHESGTISRVVKRNEERNEGGEEGVGTSMRRVSFLRCGNQYEKFHCSGRLVLPYPGLHIDGLNGPLSFPVTAWQTAELATISLDGLYGRERQLAMEKEVQGVMEIDGSLVSFTNPEWNGAIQLLSEKAVSQLGISTIRSGVRAELYTLLVHSKGVHKKPCRLVAKGNSLAVMTVQLPACFSGGQLVVRYDGEEVVCGAGVQDRSCEYSAMYMAWGCEAESELRPIAKGVRVLLVYNICDGFCS